MSQDAIRALDGRDVQGRQLRVSLACRPRPECVQKTVLGLKYTHEFIVCIGQIDI